MTREKAKKRIKKLLRWYLKEEPMSETMYMREAVNMATEALSAEPQISKSELKDKMIKYGFTAPDMTVTEFVEDFESL